MATERAATERRDRVLRKLAGMVVRATLRRVELYRTDDTIAVAGPLVSTPNHFGGALDAIVLMYALPRRPRYLARDVIWRYPVVRSLMNWIGAIPVHQAQDPGAGSNDDMFRASYEALGEGSHLVIFPEGLTRDDPSIGRVKTGAARIVLGAMAAGARDTVIVPIGIHYEDKAALRSRASIFVGAPLRPGDVVPEGATPSDRDAVTALTAAIEEGLRRAAPDFDSWEEAAALTRAAEVAVRAIGGDPVSLSQRDRIAGHLGRRAPEVRAEVMESLSSYEGELAVVGLDDESFTWARTRGRWLVAMRLLGTLLLIPYAIVGVVIHAVPFLVVRGVGRLRMAPAMMATVKPLTAVVVFAATWSVVGWLVLRAYGWVAFTGALLVLPLYLAAAIVGWERVNAIYDVVRTRRRRRRASTAPSLELRRSELVRLVVDSL